MPAPQSQKNLEEKCVNEEVRKHSDLRTDNHDSWTKDRTRISKILPVSSNEIKLMTGMAGQNTINTDSITF